MLAYVSVKTGQKTYFVDYTAKDEMVFSGGMVNWGIPWTRINGIILPQSLLFN